jgi:hypothetical protein
MPRSTHARATTSTGWSAPVSLFTHMSEQSATSSVSAASTASDGTTPEGWGATRTTFAPSASTCFTAPSTQGCSMVDVTTVVRRRSARPSQPPMIASAAASLPEPVKTISRGLDAPKARATASRATSSRFRPVLPTWWIDDGLPHVSPKARDRCAATSGSSGAPALWSR